MVLMNGSKRARLVSSLVNGNQSGGPRKAGLTNLVGHPSNVYFRLERNQPGGNYNLPLINYGSTVVGRVGTVAPFKRFVS